MPVGKLCVIQYTHDLVYVCVDEATVAMDCMLVKTKYNNNITNTVCLEYII